MTLTLYTLPTDILLDVLDYLRLPDHLYLLLKCSTLYHRLSNERGFWISIISTTIKKSCPLHADLSKRTLGEVKGLVVSWLKLQYNWNQPFPQMFQTVTYTRLSSVAEIISNVQGTDILVLNMEGKIFCWDVELATPFPFPAIETNGGHVTCISAPLVTPGVFSLTVRLDTFGTFISPTAHRYVITIKHENKKAISFTTRFPELEVSLLYDRHESLFLTEDVVGSISRGHDARYCTIKFGTVRGDNRRPHSEHVVNLSHSRRGNNYRLDASFTYKGHLYHLYQVNFLVQIQHVSRDSLRSGHCEPSGRYNLRLGSSRECGRNGCFVIPGTPFYGISAVFVCEWTGDTDCYTSFTFLPNTLTHAWDAGESSPLAFDAPSVTEHVLGRLTGPRLAIDHTGFNVAAILQSGPKHENPPRLVLVRYHPETRTTSVHTLIVPAYIDLDDLTSVCVDSTTGAIHLADNYLLTLRYV
ncbi:hypothetical protein K438DRAFT_1859339 [Mycena galopus ATCC 62051]|nr:hypothetical protein K438DRAFT_1859339 [Mycena galopus ATCC 62051]